MSPTETTVRPDLGRHVDRSTPTDRTTRTQEETMTALATAPTRPAPRTRGLTGSPRLTRPDASGDRLRRELEREEIRRVRSLAAVVAVACVDAEAGRRPLRDLAGWLAPEVYEKLVRRVDLLERTQTRPSTGAAPRPVGARVCEVAPGRVEASATILCDGHARAFALRLERGLRRWKVTSVEIG
ncbi:Rv3235 family protein [Micrococcus sp.]|uniref:Rv3235 family protein n=1 Tax=Micrococcus sp. TaxID=1271 RepID=UPI002A91EA1F|nr:Rv3235 family protein [Micrococcus sp.]MDY6055897.1 Rv3235 family protein [Micrococcus sp.]